MKAYRIAIVGCGYIADQHLGVLCRLPGLRVVGICDLDAGKAKELASRHRDPPVYDDLGKLLREERPDVVHVLTPPQSHRDLTLQILEAGSHVLVEKPMALKTSDACEMAAAAHARKLRIGVCHNFLCVPAYQQARSLIARGGLGRLISAEVYWRISSFDPGAREQIGGWVQELPGGIFHEVAPHALYLLRDLLGSLQVLAAARSGSNSTADELRVLLGWGGGVGGMTISSNASPTEKWIRIYGTDMSLQVDLGTNMVIRMNSWGRGISARAMLNVDASVQRLWRTALNTVHTVLGRMPRSHEVFLAQSYGRERSAFTPLANSEDGIAIVGLLDRIWELQETGTVPARMPE